MPLHVFCGMLATLSCALFTGGALYVSLVEHPARLQCGTRIAVTEFAPSYKRGSVMQASLAAGRNTGIYCLLADGFRQ